MVPNNFNIQAGVEYGFMSTTLDRKVAEQYSKGASDRPSIIFDMKMGMVNRGAFLGWLSYYPHEREILIPPLTGLEVRSHSTHDILRQSCCRSFFKPSCRCAGQ